MFGKIVSRALRSPSLIDQLNHLITSLRKEEKRRKAGVIFIILAIGMQLIATYNPPSSANAVNSSDIVTGGVASTNEMLAEYDGTRSTFRSLLEYNDVNRSDISLMSESVIDSKKSDNYILWSREQQFSRPQGEVRHSVTSESQTNAITETLYSRPLNLWGDRTYPAFVGSSDVIGWFAVLKDSGNLITLSLPSTALQQESPSDTETCVFEAFIASQSCEKSVEQSISVNNLTKNIDAELTTASASDRLEYTVTVKNISDQPADFSIRQPISDILEYGSLRDNGGGRFNENTGVLEWINVSIQPGESQSRKFVVLLSDTIPATPQGKSNPMSFDCRLNTSFGNSVSVTVDCPPRKIVEQAALILPKDTLINSLLISGAILSISLFMLARVRQLHTEGNAIRRELRSTGF